MVRKLSPQSPEWREFCLYFLFCLFVLLSVLERFKIIWLEVMILNQFDLLITGRLPWQPAGIKFTQCVSGQKSAFSPLPEKLCVGSKNNSDLLELSPCSLSACKVWGDQTMHAGCRSENWCFFVCYAWSACLWGDIVQTSIVWRFMGRFWWSFQHFFTMDCSFRCTI